MSVRLTHVQQGFLFKKSLVYTHTQSKWGVRKMGCKGAKGFHNAQWITLEFDGRFDGLVHFLQTPP